MGYPLFTPEQIEFFKEHVFDRGNQELTEIINNHFGLNLSCAQIKYFKKNHKLTSGLTGRLPKGHKPFNKGRKGVDGWEPTQFKKGHRPHRYKPIGSERINGDGYVDIKIQDGMAQKNWKGKHILILEEHHGRPLPPGHAVIFGDGNRRNFDPDNLILVSRKQLLVMNMKKLIQGDADLTRTGIIVADIISKISERKRARREKAEVTAQ